VPSTLHRLAALFALVALLLSTSAHAASESKDQTERGWQRFLEEQGPSHASGNRPQDGKLTAKNPTHAVVTLRVGLHYSYTATGARSEFAAKDHPLVRLSNTAGSARILDQSTGKQVAVMSPGQIYEVGYSAAGYTVSGPTGVLGTYAGPIRFSPTNRENLFTAESIERVNNVTYASFLAPQYHGAMEVVRGTATGAGKVNLVNIVALEDYVRGVVVNESPAFFAVEALKAQATAARGYAVANIGTFQRQGYPFDLVDSPASQVYRGATSEQPAGNEAANGTRALVASYQGKIITAFYSSSMGGHTENVEWVFNEPNSTFPGTNAIPYLRGIYDGAGPAPDLSTEAGRTAFWTNPQPQTYDSCERTANRFARWRMEIPASAIKARLTSGVYTLVSGTVSGDVTSVEVLERMTASQRVGITRITLTGGVVDVKGWRNNRTVFGTQAVAAPAICSTRVTPVGFPLDNPSVIVPTYDSGGAFTGVVTSGGGFGHNVGLSQYGAHGRGLAGQSFTEILKTYYTGVDIGSYPIEISGFVVRQEFVSPSGAGTLEIRPRGLKGLRVHINETYDLVLNANDLDQDVVRIDIGEHLQPGANTIQYNPVGKDGGATVLVIVD